MTFPSTLSSFTDPLATDKLNAPSHSAIERAQNAGIEQVEAVIGLAGSASTFGTIQYDLRSPDSGGGGHVQSANKGGTGQTSFTKGDILVASSSSVLTKLATGTTGQALIVDTTQATGLKWGSGNTAPTVRYYTNPSVLTWTKPSVLSFIQIEVVGGGNVGAVNTNGGGGGGGGGYAKGIIPASVLNATETITVGSIAALSSFGAHIIASPGQAGNAQAGGGGGSVSGTWSSSMFSIVTFNGSSGRNDTGATPDMARGGIGGGNVYGQGGDGAATVTGGSSGEMSGTAGTGYGAGGGGGVTAGGAATGGAGTQGFVIVYEY